MDPNVRTGLDAYDQGVEHLRRDELQLAIEAFSEAIRRNRKLAVAHHARGVTYAIRGDLRKAIKDCSRAIRLNPTVPKLYRSRGLIYWKIGDEAMAQADLRTYKRLSMKRR
jgi:Flp pilus assembly protein TadD